MASPTSDHRIRSSPRETTRRSILRRSTREPLYGMVGRPGVLDPRSRNDQLEEADRSVWSRMGEGDYYPQSDGDGSQRQLPLPNDYCFRDHCEYTLSFCLSSTLQVFPD